MRLLREPFFHFLVLGAGLFVLFRLAGGEAEEAPDRIVITETDQEQIAGAFRFQWQRDPTPEELENLIEGHIREEILYREALALGLDDNDTIVRRRMMQKVEFLMGDLIALEEPPDSLLEAYRKEHAEAYRVDPRMTFDQVFINPEKHDDGVSAAGLLRDRLSQSPEAEPSDHGDPFMLPNTYHSRSRTEIERYFGAEFAESLMRTGTGVWSGPITSSYGLHVVRVRERAPGREPDLTEIRERVVADYLAQAREKANQAFYDRLRERYEVELPE